MKKITLQDVATLFAEDRVDTPEDYTHKVDQLVEPRDQTEIGTILVPDNWVNNPEIRNNPELLETALAVSHFGAFMLGVRVARMIDAKGNGRRRGG